jgi:putative membrane protein
MIQTEKQGVFQLFRIALPFLMFTAAYAILIIGLEEHFGDHIYKVSGQIGSVFGLAVAFFLGFRMNSAYDRWWEARKIFGELTNNTRSFVAKIYAYYGNTENINETRNNNPNLQAERLIGLAILYVSQIKNEMHEILSPDFKDEDLALMQEFEVNLDNKISNELLLGLTKSIEKDFSRQANIEKSDLMQHINRFYGIQGKAERIKNTHFLKIYSAFTRFVVIVYVILIPLFIGDIDLGGEDSGLELLAIPIIVIISTAFLTINRLANLFAEPFSENTTSVNIDKICETIKSNCLEVKGRLGGGASSNRVDRP